MGFNEDNGGKASSKAHATHGKKKDALTDAKDQSTHC